MTLGMAAVGFAQPTVTQVSNAASEVPWYNNALPALQNANIAQGSYFSIYGNGLAANISTCGTNYANCLWAPYPLPTSIQGTSVSITPSGGSAIAAYIEFAAQVTSTLAQINAVMPSTVPPGSAMLTVTYNGATSAAFPITVAASSFGTFAVNQAGSGPGIITDVNYKVLSPFHTAKPGDYVLLWGTGLGPAPDIGTEGTKAPSQTNLCAAGSTCPVTVWVAGQKASVQYAGRSGYTAEDQVVFIVPQGVQGCYVQVAVQTTSGSGSVVGNFTSMTVDPNGDPCQDADGIDYNTTAIQTAINSKGSVNIGMIDLLSNYLTLDVFGTPFQWDNDTVDGELGTFTSGVLGEFQGFTISPSVGNCSVSNFLAYPPPIDPALALVTYLNAGSQLTISGPNGMQPVPTNTNGKGYGALVGGATIADLLAGGGANPYYLNASGWGGTSWTYSIESGNYTISGPGATGTNAVGAFSGTIPVSSDAAAFKWTNQSSFANPISRTSGMTITWTGGDPNGFVDITAIGSVLLSGLTPTATTPGVLVECMAPASAGTFTVPPYVLQTLPSTAGSAAAVPPGELLVGPASGAMPFSSTPTGLDAIYGFYHFIAGLNVTWQ